MAVTYLRMQLIPKHSPRSLPTVPFTEYGIQPSTWLADKNTSIERIEHPSTNEISKAELICDTSDPNGLDSKGLTSSLSLVESRQTSDNYFFGIVDQSCRDNNGPCERSLSQGTE
jgi:hypothetical protein